MAEVIEVVGGSATVEVTQGSSTTVGLTAPAGPQGPQGIQGPVGPVGTTDFTQLQNVPATFPPSTHTHLSSDVTDFNSAAAAAAPVQSVAGRNGTVTLTKADVGLGNADNTSDLNKPISTATQTALDGKAAAVHTHTISNVTGLQSALDGKQAAGSYAPSSGIAPTAITGTAVITTDSRLSDARTPTAHTHPSSAITDFSTAAAAAAPVQSVAGKTGSVALVKADVGLGSVDNTADTAKPVSTAQQTALNGKANISHTHAVADVTGLQTALDGKAASSHTHTPSDVGLGNVSNTAQVTSVTGTAPISSSGGTTPAISISAATTSAAGSMSSADKTKLDGIATGAEVNVQSNWTEANSGSDAFIQNKPTLGGAAALNVGTTTGTVAAGDDARLSDARTPTSHTHPASAISDSTTAGRALLTGADAAAQRTSLGLGTAATSATGDFAAASHSHGNLNSSGQVGSVSGLPLKTGTAGIVEAGSFGTTSGTFAEGNHTHSDLHTRSHAITSTSDHTAGNHKVFYSNGSGQVQELALGSSGTVLTSNGATSAPSFAAASGGGGSIFELQTEDFSADVNKSYACDTSGGEEIADQFFNETIDGIVFTNLLFSSLEIQIIYEEWSLYLDTDESSYFHIYVDDAEYTLQDIIDLVQGDYGVHVISAELASGFEGSDYLSENAYNTTIPAGIPAYFGYTPFIITLPEAEVGETIIIADAVGTWGDNPPTLTSEELIESETDDYSVPYIGSVTLLYIGESIGWRVIEGVVSAIPNAFSREPASGSEDGLVTWGSGFDTTGGFDVANHCFVVPTGKGGLYALNAAVFYNLPSDSQMELGIYVDSSRVRAFYVGTFDGTQGQAQVFGIVDLSEGSTVDVRVNFFGDTAAYVRADPGVSWFTGVKL